MSCGYGVLFFKQKTAYDMRISDWSSDVCSSDLEAIPRQHVGIDVDGTIDGVHHLDFHRAHISQRTIHPRRLCLGQCNLKWADFKEMIHAMNIAQQLDRAVEVVGNVCELIETGQGCRAGSHHCAAADTGEARDRITPRIGQHSTEGHTS